MSALHIAVQHGHTEVVEELVHKMEKSDLNARDNVRQISETNSTHEQSLNISFAVWYDSTHVGHKEEK